jgi:hypothetical protein
MTTDKKQRVEELQKLVARTVAVSPAGRNLLLIGGFRYRFLDGSVRTSDDIDYHWGGDLEKKQKELLALFERKLLPEVRRRLRYECTARLPTGPDADSSAVRSVELSFWQDGDLADRLEIPIEISRIVCADPIIVRTADGTLYPTVSDADMIESKVIAIFNRLYLQHRDLVDVFLFSDRFQPASGPRLAAKLKELGVPQGALDDRMADLRKYPAYHARAVQEVVDTQLDSAAADQIRDVGGGEAVLSAVLDRLTSLLEQVASGDKSKNVK